jgi:UDP-2-acetamido-3-amino-2,3-dideoxy-glucuronate N-acetyltransferase
MGRMNMKTKKTCIIEKGAKVAKDAAIGDFAVICSGAVVGKGCVIGAGAHIHEGTVLGDCVHVADNAVVGIPPRKARRSAVTKDSDLPPAKLGHGCKVGVAAIVYRGASLGKDVFVADLATIRENVEVGDETIIGRGVAVENKVKIGRRCKIETNSYITALSEIGEFCFVAPEVCFTNDNFVGRTKERFKYHKGVTMKRGARVGANSTVLPGLVLGEDCLVGAGSVVTENVPARMVAYGSPARVVREVPVEQLMENQED